MSHGDSTYPSWLKKELQVVKGAHARSVSQWLGQVTQVGEGKTLAEEAHKGPSINDVTLGRGKGVVKNLTICCVTGIVIRGRGTKNVGILRDVIYGWMVPNQKEL